MSANSTQAVAVRTLAAAMLRTGLAAGAVVGIVATGVATVVAGSGGLLAGLGGTVLVLATTLITVGVMWATAPAHPQAVMLASYGSFIFKSMVMLVALFTLGAVAGVDRMALAVVTLAVLLATTAGEGWAGYRFRGYALDPAAGSPDEAGTSGSTSGRD